MVRVKETGRGYDAPELLREDIIERLKQLYKDIEQRQSEIARIKEKMKREGRWSD